MRRTVTILTVILTVRGVALGQGQGQGGEQHEASVSKVVRLNRAPVSKEILKVTLPRPTVTKLPNGLTVLVLEQHKLPTVAFNLWIKSGAMSDPQDIPGLASFTADMLREGTSHRTSAQLATDVDQIGASLNASAPFGSNTTTVAASGLSPNTEQIFGILSDVVLNPTFPADELDKYKKRQLADLEQEKSQPSFLGREKFRQALYRDFPAAVTSATPESVEHATPELLKKFHDEYYAPNNAILGVVGDVKSDEVVALAKKYFGAWQGHQVEHFDFEKLPPPAAYQISLVDRPGSVQTNILAGDYGARRVDPDYVALRVMNQVVGGGPQARLFLNLREEKGYTYGAYSSVGDDNYREPWAANTEVRTAVTDGSMHELMYEFKRIRNQQVPETELDEARHAIVASFALSLERPQQLLTDWLLVQDYGLPQNYWDRYPVEVAQVSPAAVQEAAKKYVDLDHLQVVCVGDAKQIKSVLEKYGPVEEYDANGKRLN
ncbi:MAG TPA: pitrilysin family protein [Terriglobia bacterium]|nr:pitrilysin family protein [Terriglobia bacterium]